MKRKIFEGKCPWNDQKMVIYINEEKWQELIFQFGLTTDLKLIAKKWWQNRDYLDYFLRRFLKINTKIRLALAEYYWAEHLIILYPEIIIFVLEVKNKEDMEGMLVLRLAHEFKHAIDREKLKQALADAKTIRSKEEKNLFLKAAKVVFEKRAREFADEFGGLFVDAIEVEIA